MSQIDQLSCRGTRWSDTTSPAHWLHSYRSQKLSEQLQWSESSADLDSEDGGNNKNRAVWVQGGTTRWQHWGRAAEQDQNQNQEAFKSSRSDLGWTVVSFKVLHQYWMLLWMTPALRYEYRCQTSLIALWWPPAAQLRHFFFQVHLGEAVRRFKQRIDQTLTSCRLCCWQSLHWEGPRLPQVDPAAPVPV